MPRPARAHFWSVLAAAKHSACSLMGLPATLPPKVSLTAGPMERVRGMRRAVVESEEGKEVTGLYERLSARLAAHEADTVAAWCHQLLETSDQKLKQPLLTCCACPPE